jgi:hypothetical protein
LATTNLPCVQGSESEFCPYSGEVGDQFSANLDSSDTEYADPKRSEWITKIQLVLKKVPLRVLVKACGERLSRRELIELRAGRSKPHRKNQELLAAILKNLSLL